MATSSSALLSPATFSAAIPQKNLNSISFHRLRPLRNLGGNSQSSPSPPVVEDFPPTEHGALALPRPIRLLQLPERERGETGTGAERDDRAKEYASLLKSNVPVGFNIVDVLAWGSVGHIVAYDILATSSNGYDPNFFA